MATPQEQLREIQSKALKIQEGINTLRGGSSAAPRSGPSVITAEELENGVPQVDVQGAFQQANEASNEALGLGFGFGDFETDFARLSGLFQQAAQPQLETFENIANIQASRGQLEEEAGLPGLRTGLSEIEGELLQAETAFRRQVEAVLDRPSTGTGTKDIELRNLERRHNINRADLETIRFVRANRLEDAQAAIDRKIKLQIEPLETQLRAEQVIFENISDALTEADKRQFERNQQERQRLIDRQEFKFQQLEGFKMSKIDNMRLNGASDDQIKNVLRSGSIEEADLAAGSFGVDPYRSLQIDKLNLEIDALENPPVGTPAFDLINGLTSGDRENLPLLQETTDQVGEMIELIKKRADEKSVEGDGLDQTGIVKSLDYGFDEDSRRFRQIRADIVDKLARDRTGAVIGADEKRDFKQIVGVNSTSLFARQPSNIVSSLETFNQRHQDGAFLIDPTGQIRAAMNSQEIRQAQTSNIVDSVVGRPSGSNEYDNYMNSFNRTSTLALP